MQNKTLEAARFLGATTLALALMAGAAAAQTTATDTGAYTTGASSTSGSVGTPNTGAGGDMAANAIVLSTTAVLAIAGAAYLAKKPAH